MMVYLGGHLGRGADTCGCSSGGALAQQTGRPEINGREPKRPLDRRLTRRAWRAEACRGTVWAGARFEEA